MQKSMSKHKVKRLPHCLSKVIALLFICSLAGTGCTKAEAEDVTTEKPIEPQTEIKYVLDTEESMATESDEYYEYSELESILNQISLETKPN